MPHPGNFELVVILSIGFLFWLSIWPFWIIYEKAGFSKWLSLLNVVPLANLNVLYYVAFAKWPVPNKNSPAKYGSSQN